MIEYTPSILDIKHALRNRGATEAAATRAIAEIKAEALRGAALMFSSRLGSSYSGVAVRGMLDARADRIEGAFNE